VLVVVLVVLVVLVVVEAKFCAAGVRKCEWVFQNN